MPKKNELCHFIVELAVVGFSFMLQTLGILFHLQLTTEWQVLRYCRGKIEHAGTNSASLVLLSEVVPTDEKKTERAKATFEVATTKLFELAIRS